MSVIVGYRRDVELRWRMIEVGSRWDARIKK
jgi:hypothetical protein